MLRILVCINELGTIVLKYVFMLGTIFVLRSKLKFNHGFFVSSA